MHLHRSAFELTEFHGKATAGLMKDTIVVPPNEEVEMLVTPRQTGAALFQCHNQMHMDAGLQVLFTVDSETDQRYRKTGKQ
jgi:FtsP/CotA-like multicopper oxidase with cupredoxin domain